MGHSMQSRTWAGNVMIDLEYIQRKVYFMSQLQSCFVTIIYIFVIFINRNLQSTNEGRVPNAWQCLYVCAINKRKRCGHLSRDLRVMTCNTFFSLVCPTLRGGAPQVPLQDCCGCCSRFTDYWQMKRGQLKQKMHPESCKHTVPVLRTKEKHKSRKRDKSVWVLKKNHRLSLQTVERSEYFVDLHSLFASSNWNKNRASILTVKNHKHHDCKSTFDPERYVSCYTVTHPEIQEQLHFIVLLYYFIDFTFKKKKVIQIIDPHLRLCSWRCACSSIVALWFRPVSLWMAWLDTVSITECHRWHNTVFGPTWESSDPTASTCHRNERTWCSSCKLHL